MGFVFSSYTAGTLIGPVVGGILFDHYGYTVPFMFVSAFILMNFVIQLFCAEVVIEKSNGMIEKSNGNVSEYNQFKLLFRNSNLLIILLGIVITGMGASLVDVFLPIYLAQSFSYTPTQISLGTSFLE